MKENIEKGFERSEKRLRGSNSKMRFGTSLAKFGGIFGARTIEVDFENA